MRTALKYPDPILLKPAEDFDFETDKPLLDDLKDAAREGFGWGNLVGLAAPQIGISKRFFLALGKIYINPVIVDFSKEIFETKEGCYSLKDHTSYPILRHREVTLEWQNFLGKTKRRKFFGLEAQVIQHEHDHLLGKLCRR